jgi:hypothetical protein
VAADRSCLLYLYGVVAPDSGAAELLRERRIPGIEQGQPLFAIEAAGLVAAVSRVPAALFDEEPLNALVADLERLAPYAVRHEEAMRAMIGSAVIPMTFGAVYRTREGITALLREHAADFGDRLARFDGRCEWGLKVFVDHARLAQFAEQESDALRALAEEAAAASPGRAYLIMRKREQMLIGEADRLTAGWLAAIVGRLTGMSTDVALDEPVPVQPGAETLVCKVAFLVGDDGIDAFREGVDELRRTYAPRGLRLELSGPWAPYSFARSWEMRDA